VKKQSGNGDFFQFIVLATKETVSLAPLKALAYRETSVIKNHGRYGSCDYQRIQDVSNLHFLLRSSHSPEKWLWRKGQKFFEMPKCVLFFIRSLQGNPREGHTGFSSYCINWHLNHDVVPPLHPFNPRTYLVSTPKGL
jgi:hypothetical protein